MRISRRGFLRAAATLLAAKAVDSVIPPAVAESLPKILGASTAYAADDAPNVATINGYKTIVYDSLVAPDRLASDTGEPNAEIQKIIQIQKSNDHHVTLFYNPQSGHGTLRTQIEKDGAVHPYFVNFTTIEGGKYRAITSGQTGNPAIDAGLVKDEILDKARIDEEIDMALNGAAEVARKRQTGPMHPLFTVQEPGSNHIYNKDIALTGVMSANRQTHSTVLSNTDGGQRTVQSHKIISRFESPSLPESGLSVILDMISGQPDTQAALDQISGYLISKGCTSFESQEGIKRVERAALNLMGCDLNHISSEVLMQDKVGPAVIREQEQALESALRQLPIDRRVSLAPQTPTGPVGVVSWAAPKGKPFVV
ncbi:MAG TPA: hypothetical protein DCY07_03300 [Rhodospirillaceae bacterium]|nr:hypothetical protein [Rhodospirillaceae bacterium]